MAESGSVQAGGHPGTGVAVSETEIQGKASGGAAGAAPSALAAGAAPLALSAAFAVTLTMDGTPYSVRLSIPNSSDKPLRLTLGVGNDDPVDIRYFTKDPAEYSVSLGIPTIEWGKNSVTAAFQIGNIPPPKITAATHEGDKVVITGEHFDDGAHVLYGATRASNVEYASATKLKAKKPTDSGAIPLVVVVGGFRSNVWNLIPPKS